MRKCAYCLLVHLACVLSQFRGGHISWRPVGPYTVELAVKTAWVRSSGTFVKVISGSPIPNTISGYQPVKGDVINILGFETPKVLALGYDDNGMLFEQYLQATVTFNTESLPQGDASQGLNLPHLPTASDWSYYGNNWIEAISYYNVTFPRRDITYPVELHGCCRQGPMRVDTTGAIQFRDGTGILQQPNTPYSISVFVRMDRDPPPISFLPIFLPCSKETIETRLDLPILDFMASNLEQSGLYPPDSAGSWADVINEDAQDAVGDLFHTQSRPATGRRLHQTAASDATSTNGLTASPKAASVKVTPSRTGTDYRMLPLNRQQNSNLIIVYLQGACASTSQSVSIPAGMDICQGSPVQYYPDGGMVMGNFSSMLLPAGILISLTDGCEYTNPIGVGGNFDSGNVIASFASPTCYDISSFRQKANTFRILQQADLTAASQLLSVSYRTLNDGRSQASLVIANLQNQGNYAIKLRAATNVSSAIDIEFIIHLMSSTANQGQETYDTGRKIVPSLGFPASSTEPMGPTDAIIFPTGFETDISWTFSPAYFQTGPKFIFDNEGLGVFMTAPPTTSNSNNQWMFKWIPCSMNAGGYYYCIGAQQAYAPYDFAATKCAFLQVRPVLPPAIDFLESYGENITVSVEYSVYIGDSLNLIVRASSNSLDAIETFGISQVNLNTGDKIRAKVMYKYANYGTSAAPRWSVAPRLLEPSLPTYLGLTVSAGVVNSFQNTFAMDRQLSFTPSRLHSGLKMEICFVAVDSRGSCKMLGTAMTRCLQISVVPCRYRLGPSQSLMTVAGLFETNWIQLFALNPTFTTPDVPAVNSSIINIGHLYEVPGQTFESGQSLEQIRIKFGTTSQALMVLNAWMTRTTMAQWDPIVPAGTVLCLMPMSCETDI